jgi:hypothetical protein
MHEEVNWVGRRSTPDFENLCESGKRQGGLGGPPGRGGTGAKPPRCHGATMPPCQAARRPGGQVARPRRGRAPTALSRGKGASRASAPRTHPAGFGSPPAPRVLRCPSMSFDVLRCPSMSFHVLRCSSMSSDVPRGHPTPRLSQRPPPAPSVASLILRPSSSDGPPWPPTPLLVLVPVPRPRTRTRPSLVLRCPSMAFHIPRWAPKDRSFPRFEWCG